MTAILINTTLDKRLAAKNYTRSYINAFEINITPIQPKGDKNDHAALKLDIINPDRTKFSYTIDPWLNETNNPDEMLKSYHQLDFPAFITKNLEFIDHDSHQHVINNEAVISAFTRSVKKNAGIDLTYVGVDDPFSHIDYNRPIIPRSPSEKNQIDHIFTNNNSFSVPFFFATRITLFSPSEKEKCIRELKKIGEDCMNFCNIALHQSFVRRVYDISKQRGIKLTFNTFDDYASVIKSNDNYSRLISDAINGYRNFVWGEKNCHANNIPTQIVTCIYNTLKVRSGEPIEMMRFTSALLSLMINKRLVTLDYDENQIKALNIKVYPLIASDISYFATKLTFVMDNKMHSTIFDSFLNQSCKEKNLHTMYDKYGADYLIPNNIKFNNELNMLMLIKKPEFLQAIEKIIESIFDINLSDIGAENPFKDVAIPSQSQLEHMLSTFRPALPDFLQNKDIQTN